MSKLRALVVISGLLLVSGGSLSAQEMKVSCKDGTKSAGGQGACSGHGGVADALVTCKDGTKSAGGQGACSSHGGVSNAALKGDAKLAKTQTSVDTKNAKMALKGDAKVQKAADKAEDRDAKGATALCKDKTYSHSKSPQGMCSGHGGVAKLLGGK